RRFVADTPPSALVERVAATYTRTDGDVKAMLRTIVEAPEFWSEDAYRAKVKTPLEFVASAARALSASVDARGAFELARASAEARDARRPGRAAFESTDHPPHDRRPRTGGHGRGQARRPRHRLTRVPAAMSRYK